jgi:hypothetical protein
MSGDIAARNAAVVAAVKSWNRIQEKCRRLLMLYRESKDGELIVDVLQFHVAFEKREANGKVYGWLAVWGPEVYADEYSQGARHLSWTREFEIPLAYVVHKKLLPPLWPGFDGFAVNSRDPVMREMQDKYEQEVQEGLAIAAEKGFTQT